MSKNIKRLTNEKQQIYRSMLTLLERKHQSGGYIQQSPNWKVNILGDIVVTNTDPLSALVNKSAQLNGMTISQAMESSFSRIITK